MDSQISDTRIMAALAKLAQQEAETFDEASKWLLDNEIHENFAYYSYYRLSFHGSSPRTP
jgi:hypothetical protein